MREASERRTVTDTESYAFSLIIFNANEGMTEARKKIMKYLKTKFLICFAILFAGFALSSCSNNESENDVLSELVGTWVHEEDLTLITVTYEYEFSSNNRFTWSAADVVMEKGTYSLNDNLITCVPDEENHLPSTLELKYTGSEYIILDRSLDIEYFKKK